MECSSNLDGEGRLLIGNSLVEPGRVKKNMIDSEANLSNLEGEER